MLSFQMPSSCQAIFRRSFVLLVVALVMLLRADAQAQVQGTFENGGLYTYSGNLNATNIINDEGGTFSVTPAFGTGWLADLYQAWHYTRGLTNFGEMDSLTGFRYDTLISQHAEASSFYNASIINCGAFSNAVFLVQGVTVSGLLLGGYGGIQVWATNVFNSGTINIGADGLGRIYGQNLDFTRGTVSMQNAFLEALTQTNTSTIYATGQVGVNGANWYPDISLLPNSATSALPPLFIPQDQAGNLPTTLLPTTTPYFSVDDDGTGTNKIVRMVFLQNDYTNVPYNVYFGSGFGNGFTTIEWVGSYVDPASGNLQTQYFYMTEDYVQGSSTNLLANYAGGVPNNYGFYETNTRLLLGVPQLSNYPSIFGLNQPFPPGFPVNGDIYSYVNAQLAVSTVSTNSVVNGAITNLPGRIELVASNELNLSLSTLNGMNYLLLNSTNNFDDDGQSLISSPYSDVYLGRTNGTMMVSNLLEANIPIFNGAVQGWTTRWFYTDTNNGINYDYRVLLVESGLNPESSSQQQDVCLYSSNNITISDTLNIFRTCYLNCTNLLLTTNAVGNGAASLDGELNIWDPAMFWASSTPRLCNLTNNGAIRTVTQTKFGSPAMPYFAFVNTGTVSNGAGTVILANDVEHSGFFSSGSGSFVINSIYTTMTNGIIVGAGSFTNTSSIFTVSNTVIEMGKAMTITATNLLTDGGTTNNFWSLGTANGGLGIATGLILPILPGAGDLLGTTITNPAVAGTFLNELWAGKDYGAVNAGFHNNAAIGQLILDAQGTAPHTGYFFSGTATNGATNAIYVDCLQIHDYAGYTHRSGTTLPTLTFNTNLVIYYAQALTDGGISVAEQINHFNGNHLRWVPTYAGTFSGTNLVYPNGTTNFVNAALAESPDIDSNGNGSPNDEDPARIFVPSELNFTITLTNLPPKSVKLSWVTVANGTNYVYYRTNLLSPTWMPFNSFKNFYYNLGSGVMSGTNAAHTNWFASPLPYPSNPTNVWIYDTVTNMPHFYQIVVQPWLTYPN